MYKHIALPLTLLIALIISTNTYAQEPVQIQVTNKVLRPASEIPPLGHNGFGDIGAVQYSSANLIKQAGFEPAMMRDLYLVTTSGKDKGKRWITLDGPGTSWYALYNTGTYSGGSMRAYRITQAGDKQTVNKITETKVLPKNTPNFPDGGWLADLPGEYGSMSKLSKQEQQDYKAKNWRVYYESDTALQAGDVVIFTKNYGWPDKSIFHPRTFNWKKDFQTSWSVNGGTYQFVPHPISQPTEMDGGDQCMKVTPKASNVMVTQNAFGSPDRKDVFWYGQLEPGLTYRYEVWLRCDSTNQVTLGFATSGKFARGYFGHKLEQTFTINNQWQKVGFEFTAPPRPTQGGLGGPAITFTNQSPVYIDNIKLMPVYEVGDADKPFTVNRTQLNAILDGQPATGIKGALRVWEGLTSCRMQSLLSWHNDSELKAGAYNSLKSKDMTIPRSLMFMEATGDSPQTRVVPWLIIQVLFDEDEYRGLIEYLAAPFDPKKDTAKNKPWAYKRYTQRGHGRPWIDDFRELIIEFGNENWHNRAHSGWVGFGKFKHVHRFGREYGLFCRYFVDQIKQSPYWSDQAEQKIRFSLGGNYSTRIQNNKVIGYGQEASQAFNLPVYEGHATYIGPRWEMNEAAMTEIDDAGFQRMLTSYIAEKQSEWQKQNTSWQLLKKQGYDVTMVAYEGGPSGFDMPQIKKLGIKAPSEVYGKSLSAGVAAFDGWMDAYRMGWTHQCYLAFSQGLKWSSHTSFAQDFRPSPGFLAQQMRNRYMTGDMVEVKLSNVPQVTTSVLTGRGKQAKLTQTQVPAMGVYAMRAGDQLSVALLSRQLQGEIPVALNLPIEQAGKINCYMLAGDPRSTNILEKKVDIQSLPVSNDKLKQGVMQIAPIPAGSIVIYTFDQIH
ncbi:MAG TPA: hypothetical protein DER01_04565 [Phycisphaerales bacterium]|nr:hypothetical protein [Phycisphaerales bacterium]